jgi:Grx4 family monothiol glutaredoxin
MTRFLPRGANVVSLSMPSTDECGRGERAQDFETFDVLSDGEIREGIKAYSNWPTIPQLYIDGEFMGGCDVMIEMYQNGELQEEVEKAAAS